MNGYSKSKVPFLSIFCSVILLFTINSITLAQESSYALLVYADNVEELHVIDTTGIQRSISIGDTLEGGESLWTENTSAEIELVPNGSIFKISRNTTFKIEGLAAEGMAELNDFHLLKGKLRTVASRSSGDEQYRLRTATAVCGVRGTDFSLSVEEGVKDAIYVKHGLVEFGRVLVDGNIQNIMVSQGQYADVFAPMFEALTVTDEQVQSEFGDLEFTELNPEAVSEAPEAVQNEAFVASEDDEEAAQASEVESGPSPVPSQTADSPVPPLSQKSFLGFEIGSVVMDGATYSKVIIQPTFSLGKLRFSLYIPIIYTSDIFDSSSWYHPEGNDEWSFGSDYWDDDPEEGLRDAFRDFALKIRYIEYGQPLVDPFFLKIGNLSNMTIGHGILMRNYANDADFPAIRRIGFNSGFDLSSWGLEGMANDLAKPEVYGGRIKMFHIFGLSTIIDIDPAGDLKSEAEQDALGDPMLVGAAADIDIPILKLNNFQLRAFIDVAAIAPFTRKALPGVNDTGLQLHMVFDKDAESASEVLNNYGLIGGFMGRLVFLDWRLEYHHQKGIFTPNLFNGVYERNRVKYTYEYISWLQNPPVEAPIIEGIYGEASFSTLSNGLSFTAGYLLPWSLDEKVSWEDVSKDDYLLARITLNKGLLPFFGIWGSLSFERTGFAYALSQGNSLMDADTIFKGELVVPIVESVDFAIVASNAAVRTSALSLTHPRHETSASITFETRISF